MYWAGASTIAFECSNTLCSLTQSAEFKPSAKAAFATYYNRHNSFGRRVTPDELIFTLSHVEYQPVEVHEKVKISNQCAKRQEKQLAESCGVLSETYFPLLVVYTSHDFATIKRLGDEESKKLADADNQIRQQVAPLFHRPRTIQISSTKRERTPKSVNSGAAAQHLVSYQAGMPQW